MNNTECPFVSVIIPVFNDAERLKRCLAALSQQRYPADRFEIVVIDNGSDDPGAIADSTRPFSQVTLTVEPAPGSYIARNKGISMAMGEIIAFTDADCIPASDWLAEGVACLQQTPNCGQVVGNVELFFVDSQRPTLVEVYESLTALRQDRLLKQFHGGATANVFTWRQVIEQVGLFNTRLKSAGDMEWGNRIFQAGYQQIYAPNVRVQHPARSSFQALKKRALRLAGGAYNWCIKPEDSFIQKQKMFARLLLDKLIEPVKFSIETFRDPKIKSLGQRLGLTSISFYLRYAGAAELIRLKLGGNSNRE